nr:hypothetical protein [uncultured Rhodopila sp.]
MTGHFAKPFLTEARLPMCSPALPARSYCAYIPERHAGNPAVSAFCVWLHQAAADQPASGRRG